MSAETLTVSSRTPVERKTSSRPALGIFERFLSVWVALCIVAGIASDSSEIGNPPEVARKLLTKLALLLR